MSTYADNTVTEVTAQTDAADAVAALVNCFVAGLDDAGTDPARLKDLRDSYFDDREKIVAAALVGTLRPPSHAGVVTAADAATLAAAAVERRANYRVYGGNHVAFVREARPSDQGYNTMEGGQVIIRLADGTQKVVPAGEVTDVARARASGSRSAGDPNYPDRNNPNDPNRDSRNPNDPNRDSRNQADPRNPNDPNRDSRNPNDPNRDSRNPNDPNRDSRNLAGPRNPNDPRNPADPHNPNDPRNPADPHNPDRDPRNPNDPRNLNDPNRDPRNSVGPRNPGKPIG